MKERIKQIKKSNTAIISTMLLFVIIKSIMFTLILTSHNGEFFSVPRFSLDFMPAYIATIILFVIPMLYFKKKGRIIYFAISNLILTGVIYIDLLLYRASSCYLGLKHLFYPELFDPSNNLPVSVKPIDILFIVDLVLIAVLVLFAIKYLKETKRSFIISTALIATCIGVITIANINNNFFQYHWVDYESMKNMGPIAYHAYEIYDAIEKQNRELTLEEKEKVDSWLEWNDEDLPDNEYKGIFEGKNVVYIQAESLENFVIGQKVNGQEITPVLNRLIKEGMYFPNIYEQNSGGNSVDADLMVNTGIFPLEESIAFLTDPEPVYNSMPRILKEEGYTSNTLHVIKSADYRWAENHKHSLGFDDVWDINDFKMTFRVGNYYSDQELFEQQAEKVKDKEKFYSMIPTATSHGPFYIPDEYKMLDLTEEQNENRLGEYFQMMKYLDTQIGHYLDIMSKQGQLENTVFVIYGDHGGVHKYYRDMIVDAPFEGDFWQEDNMKLPFIIYSPDGPVLYDEVHGGLVDVMPTVLYTLGIEADNIMGRNLLNTERNATVYTNRDKQRTIAGEVKNTEEEKRLLEAYDVSKIIIKDKYFEAESTLK